LSIAFLRYYFVILEVAGLASTRDIWRADLAKLLKKALIEETRGLVVVAEGRLPA